MRPAICASAAVAFALIAAAPSRAQSLAGNWRGKVNPQTTIALHIVVKPNAYTATASNPKAGLTRVPATITVTNGTSVSFTTSVLGSPATFNGRWDGSNTITGTLNQVNSSTNLTLTRVTPGAANSVGSTTPSGSNTQSLAGNWKGTTSTGQPIVFQVAANGTGYKATADYGNLNFIKVPTTVTVTRRKVSFNINYLGQAASFSGRRTENTITGTFDENGKAAPMTLTR